MQAKLDWRERLALGCGLTALLLVFAMLFYIPTGPKKEFEDAKDAIKRLEGQHQLAQVDLMEAQDRLQSQELFMEQLKGRPARFDLFSFVERTLREKDLMERAELSRGRPSRNAPANQPMVDLNLSNVSLDELITFLHKVYAENYLVVMYKLNLKPAVRDHGLSCEITFATIKV
jgi:hypothetical protein